MSNEPIEHRFLAGLLSFADDGKGGHTAQFYIMNTSRNRNKWGVSDHALTDALHTLKGAKLGMGAGYKTDKHYPEGQIMAVGVFTGYEKLGSYATGTARIADTKTWNLMKAGSLGPISVVIYSYRDVCSKCGAELGAMKDPFAEHKCLKEGDAYAQVESFKFKRVDFIDVPAYPQAGLLEIAAKAADKSVPLELLASFYESQAQKTEVNSTHQNEEDQSLTDEEKEKIAGLEKTNRKLEEDLKAANAKAKENEDNYKTLKAQLDVIVKAQHDELVTVTLAARVKAKVAGKPEDEKTLLAALPNETLTILKADAEKVAGIASIAAPAGPLTKYGKSSDTDLETAVKEKAASLGFPDRTKEVA
jgi:hypothetical protein